MMIARNIACSAFVALSALLASVALRAQEMCPAGRLPPVSSPALKKALAGNQQIMIVALGSSSTEGVRATSAANSYPAQLQADLAADFPTAHFAVINRGVGGQDAQEELARLNDDVLAVRPTMVIWQVGANGAMGRADPEAFRALVSTGIERLKARGIDVILMDNQRSPMILASPAHVVFEHILADLAIKYDVSLFSRGSLMDGWKRGGNGYERFLASDNVHMNDFGYRCLASALASSLEEGLGASNAAKLAAIRTVSPVMLNRHASN